jgi:hypothetical protein
MFTPRRKIQTKSFQIQMPPQESRDNSPSKTQNPYHIYNSSPESLSPILKKKDTKQSSPFKIWFDFPQSEIANQSQQNSTNSSPQMSNSTQRETMICEACPEEGGQEKGKHYFKNIRRKNRKRELTRKRMADDRQAEYVYRQQDIDGVPHRPELSGQSEHVKTAKRAFEKLAENPDQRTAKKYNAIHRAKMRADANFEKAQIKHVKLLQKKRQE